MEELGNQTQRSIDRLSAELKLARDALAASVDVAAKAVPGERWARLLDGLGSANPAVRQETKQFLLNLAGQADSPIAESTYKLVVGFDFDDSDDKKPFHVDFGRFVGADRSFVEAFVLQRSANLDATPKRTNLSPLSEAQVRSAMLDKAEQFISKITGSVHAAGVNGDTSFPVNCSGRGYCFTFTFDDTIITPRSNRNATSYPVMEKNIEAVTATFNKRREEIKNAMVDLALTAYSYRETRMDNLSSYRDWSLVDGKNFVIVVIDKDTYDKHIEDWKLTIRVQQSNNPDVSLFQRPAQILKRASFDPKVHEPIKREDDRIVYWAFVEMTGDLNISLELMRKVEDLKRALNAWKH